MNEPQVYDDTLARGVRPARIDVYPALVVVDGRQQYRATPWSLQAAPEADDLIRERALLASVITPSSVAQRSVLDLGSGGGFFGLWALRLGAASATCVDADPQYVALTRTVAQEFGTETLQSVQSDVARWDQPAGIVLALAPECWHPEDADPGALVERLAGLTQYLLAVAWDEPDKLDARRNGHSHEPSGPAALEAALGQHFARVERLGQVTARRTLYVAYKGPFSIELDNPLPLLEHAGEMISSRRLTTVNGIDYWSRVHRDVRAGTVTKQATLDLAAREARFLQQLDGAFFPRSIASWSTDDYSVVVLELTDSVSLAEAAPEIRASYASMAAFALDCITIVERLQRARIWHRDIHPENVLVRNGAPILAGFGWAISQDDGYDNPDDLLARIQDADGVHLDAYAMGQVIDYVNASVFPEIHRLVTLMCDDQSALRLVDTRKLRAILAVESGMEAEGLVMDDDGVAPRDEGDIGEATQDGVLEGEDRRLARELVEQLVQRNRRIHLLEQRIDGLVDALAERQSIIAELDHRRMVAEVALQGKDAEVATERAELQRRDAALEAIPLEIAAWEAQVAAAQADLQGRDGQVAALRADLENRDANLVALQAEVQRQSAALAAALIAAQAALEGRSADLEATRAELQRRDTALSAARIQLQNREAQLERVEARLAQIKASRVWHLGQLYWRLREWIASRQSPPRGPR